MRVIWLLMFLSSFVLANCSMFMILFLSFCSTSELWIFMNFDTCFGRRIFPAKTLLPIKRSWVVRPLWTFSSFWVLLTRLIKLKSYRKKEKCIMLKDIKGFCYKSICREAICSDDEDTIEDPISLRSLWETLNVLMDVYLRPGLKHIAQRLQVWELI